MLRRRDTPRKSPPVQLLYRAIIGRAREKSFYIDWHVPDTFDGRFDLLALHAFLIFEALRGQPGEADEIGRRLADTIFSGFDQALRELGVSDFGMSRRVRKLADAFYGRVHHYGLAHSRPALASAVQRNLYRGDTERGREADLLASYIMDARARLHADIGAVLAGNPDFGPLPRMDGT